MRGYMAAVAGSLLIGSAAQAAVTIDLQTADTANNYRGTITNATGVTRTLASWLSDVQSAYTAERGGVWNMETAGAWGANQVDTSFTLRYGASLGSSLVVTTSKNMEHSDGFSFGTSSGSLAAFPQGENGPMTLNFAPPAGARITQLGFVLMPRNGFSPQQTVTWTATFSDNTTQAISVNPANSNLNNLGGGVFLHFEAPASTGITSLKYESTNNTRANPFDDLAFVTVVPEPASLVRWARPDCSWFVVVTPDTCPIASSQEAQWDASHLASRFALCSVLRRYFIHSTVVTHRG